MYAILPRYWSNEKISRSVAIGRIDIVGQLLNRTIIIYFTQSLLG